MLGANIVHINCESGGPPVSRTQHQRIMRAFSKKIASVCAAYSLFLKTVEANVELELVSVENLFQQTDRKNTPIVQR